MQCCQEKSKLHVGRLDEKKHLKVRVTLSIHTFLCPFFIGMCVCVRVCVCVYVCVCEREREREGEGQRERDRERT